MTISLFASGTCHGRPWQPLDAGAVRELGDALLDIPALRGGHLYEPAQAQTYHRDGPPPALALRLDFEDLPALEQELLHGGRLHSLARSPLWQALELDEVQHQVMLRRSFLAAAPGSIGAGAAAYLVHYPGHARDFNAWLRYYLAHHPQIMRTYPGVRAVDVFTRLDWCDDMPWTRVAYMQRNSLCFDSTAALVDGICSPVRERMRADHDRFPVYEGGSRHWAMRVSRQLERGSSVA